MTPSQAIRELDAILATPDGPTAARIEHLRERLEHLRDRLEAENVPRPAWDESPRPPALDPGPGPLLDLTLRGSRVARSGTRESPWMDVVLERWPPDLAAVVQQVRLELHGLLDFAHGRDYRVTIAPAPDDDGAG